MPRFCHHCGRPGIRSVCRACRVKPHGALKEEKAAIRRDFEPSGQYHNEKEWVALKRLGL